MNTELLQGTFIEDILKNEAPMETITEKIGKGEVEIGKLTNFEKSIYSLRDQRVDECETMCKKELHFGKMSVLHINLHREIELLTKIFWDSIRLRIPAAEEADTIGLRANDTIVSCKSKKEELRDSLGMIEIIFGRK